MAEHSGAQWCARYPTSTSIVDLVDPFRGNLSAYIQALQAAGATVAISATYRPEQRAYLMHWACMIGAGGQDPAAVPAMAGVDIDWTHGGDRAAAKLAAQAMMKGYSIAFPAALVSRHTQRRAVDMTIKFAGTIQVKDRAGRLHPIARQEDLYRVGAGYGVHKLVTDAPHWSDDGH